jgi:hypothetical protein
MLRPKRVSEIDRDRATRAAAAGQDLATGHLLGSKSAEITHLNLSRDFRNTACPTYTLLAGIRDEYANIARRF